MNELIQSWALAASQRRQREQEQGVIDEVRSEQIQQDLIQEAHQTVQELRQLQRSSTASESMTDAFVADRLLKVFQGSESARDRAQLAFQLLKADHAAYVAERDAQQPASTGTSNDALLQLLTTAVAENQAAQTVLLQKLTDNSGEKKDGSHNHFLTDMRNVDKTLARCVCSPSV